MITFYHNPRCSKSRQALALLEHKTDQINIVLYLKTPVAAETLKRLANKLKLSNVRDMMRTKEAEYKSLGLADLKLSDDALFQAMANNPKLLERPIAETENSAKIGRPPENVLSLIEQ